MEPTLPPPGPLRVLAPAKINLHLRVGRRRAADGFHPLTTWMCTVGLFDTLTFWTEQQQQEQLRDRQEVGSTRTGRAGEQQGLALRSDLVGLPCDGRNLVVRIANAWDESLSARGLTTWGQPAAAPGDAPAKGIGRASGEASGAEVAGTADAKGPGWVGGPLAGREALLEKRIPVGAGLGGGSSDAARTLLLLNQLTDQLWGAGWAADRLSGFAVPFGSDLPFFVRAYFDGPSAVCTGRGEVVRPVPRPRPKAALLVLPDYPLSTAEVYRRFDELGLGEDTGDETGIAGDEPDWAAWANLDAAALMSRLENDLEPAAFDLRPELGALREEVERSVGRAVRMSGSGSSLFTLFDTEQQASAAAGIVASGQGVGALAVELCPDFRDDLNAPVAER